MLYRVWHYTGHPDADGTVCFFTPIFKDMIDRWTKDLKTSGADVDNMDPVELVQMGLSADMENLVFMPMLLVASRRDGQLRSVETITVNCNKILFFEVE